MRRILLVGGGTGGHISPLLAVAHELKKIEPDARLDYVGERGGKFKRLVLKDTSIDEARFILAGKFRRYHGESWLRRLLDVRTNLLNIRDALYTLIGFCQSVWLLLRRRPDVVFIKGGYVGVPIGLAAALLKVPFITHDSDAVPGLANRVVGRWARLHATGMPEKFYDYPPDRTYFVGVPVSGKYVPVDSRAQAECKRELGVAKDAKVILVMGGSQGARNLNKALSAPLIELADKHDRLHIFHQTGKGGQDMYADAAGRSGRIHAFEFSHELFVYSGAADIVISRAGASSIAELAVQGKACILVPHPKLAGNHQTRNAEHLKEQAAALVFSETSIQKNPDAFKSAVEELLRDDDKRHQLASRLAALGKPDATRRLAKLILGAV